MLKYCVYGVLLPSIRPGDMTSVDIVDIATSSTDIDIEIDDVDVDIQFVQLCSGHPYIDICIPYMICR